MAVLGHMYNACVEPGILSKAVKDMPCRGFQGRFSYWDDLALHGARLYSTELSLVTPSCPACQGKKCFSEVMESSPAHFNLSRKGKQKIGFSEV